MKPFLKFALVLVLAVVAVKFLPALALAGVIAGLVLGALVFGGISLAAILVMVAVVVGVLLTPLWLPVLALVGVVALVRWVTRSSAAV
jgi:hypothetical protein